MKAAIPLVLSLSVLLVGCSTTGNMRKVDLKQASQLNAELALRYLQQGDLQQAKIKGEKAIEQHKNNALANNINGTIQQRLGKMAKADAYFRRAVELAPDQPEYANGYGVYLCEVGRIQDGVKQFVAVANNPLHRTPALAYENAAICSLKDKQTEIAEEFLNRALTLKPDYSRARFGLAELQFSERRYNEALVNVQQLEREDQLNAEAAAIGARSAKALSRPDVAEHYIYMLRSRFPDSYQARSMSN